MSDLDLRLPDEKRPWRPGRPSRLATILALVTLAVLVALVVRETLVRPGNASPEWQRRQTQLDKTVAERLADTGQYRPAAAHLMQYATRAQMSPAERARLFYRAADLYMRAGGMPDVGKQPELVGHVFALAEGQTSAAPLELDGRFYVFKIRKRVAQRTPPFEEVEDRVRRLKYEQRRAERMDALVKELMAKYNATIHRGAFRTEAPSTPPKGSSPQ
jgi:hypothetical protein